MVDRNVMITGATTSWKPLLSAATFASAVTSRPHAKAPSISEAMFTNGVAFNMGSWLTRPTSRPIATD